jgi:hypothetical protein
MFKYVIFTFIILWLSFKVAGFVIRMFLRSAGFSINVNGKQAFGTGQKQASDAKTGASTNQTRHVTDKLGDYVDFEEVK